MNREVKIVGGTFMLCFWIAFAACSVKDVHLELKETNKQLEKIAERLNTQ